MRKQAQTGSTRNSILLLVVLLINAVVIGLGGMALWRDRKKEEKEIASKKAAVEAAAAEKQPKVSKLDAAGDNAEKKSKDYFKQVIPFEGVLTNMAGDNGRRILRMNLEVEFQGEGVLAEVERLKPRIRDVILNSASDLDYNDAAKPEVREQFKKKIIENINAEITKGKAVNVYFTEFQTN